jgi:hypothetical protein
VQPFTVNPEETLMPAMTSETIDQERRTLLGVAATGLAAVSAASLFPAATAAAASGAADIRPFTVNIPEADIVDLRRRLAHTRLPEQETVADKTQGVQLKTIKQLLTHWEKNYDWRRVETRINSVPNFITEIDGLDIHFLHIRSKHDDALPLIVTHGWPGSIVEQMKLIGPLTDPTAHGGTAADAFHLIIPHRFPATAFPESQRKPGGVLSASPVPGSSLCSVWATGNLLLKAATGARS